MIYSNYRDIFNFFLWFSEQIMLTFSTIHNQKIISYLELIIMLWDLLVQKELLPFGWDFVFNSIHTLTNPPSDGTSLVELLKMIINFWGRYLSPHFKLLQKVRGRDFMQSKTILKSITVKNEPTTPPPTPSATFFDLN